MALNLNDLKNKLNNRSGTIDTFMNEARKSEQLSRKDKERKLLDELGNERPKMSKSKKIAIGTAAGVLGATAAIIPTTKYLIDSQKYIITVKLRSEDIYFESHRLEVKKGTVIKNLVKYEVTGYEFVGYYKDEACTIPYSTDEKIEKGSQVFYKYIPKVYNVNYLKSDQYIINADNTVEHGSDFVFTVYAKPGYQLTNVVVKVNGIVVNLTNGAYVFKNVESDLNISIENVEEVQQTVIINTGKTSTEIEVYDRSITLQEVLNENKDALIEIASLEIGNVYEKEKLKDLSVEEILDLFVYDCYKDSNAENKIDLTKEITDFENYNLNIYLKLATIDKCMFEQNTVEAKNQDISGNLVIPKAWFDGENVVPITTVKENGFKNCINISSVTIGNNITEIGTQGFAGLEKVSKIIYEVESLSLKYNSYIFKGMGKSVETCELIVGRNVKTLSSYTFSNATGITKVRLFDGLTEIGTECFITVTNLKEINLPNSITTLGSHIFYECENLETVNFPINDAIKEIPISMFLNCKKIQKIEIPNSITTINHGAFYNCQALQNVTIPNGVTFIGEGAFQFCESFTTITIPETVTEMGNKAFQGCVNVTELNYNANLTTAYTRANCAPFYNLGNELKTTVVNIGANVKKLNRYLFYQAYGIQKVNFAKDSMLTEIEDDVFYVCASLTEITIPNSVISIGNWAFRDCSGLTSLTIGSGVISIYNNSFGRCAKLESITVDVTNKKYHSTGNCLIETDTKTLIKGCKNSVIPTDGSVTSIGDSAFSSCTGLTEITIPNSVTQIGDSAFSSCTGLTEITIPNSVISMGEYAFNSCTGLINVTIGSGITSIGSRVFFSCTSLAEITIPNSVTSIGSSAFNGCAELIEITIPNSVTSIGKMAFSGCSKLTKVTFGNVSGWWVSTSSTATSGSTLSGSSLSDTSTAAKWLTSTHRNDYWKRKA